MTGPHFLLRNYRTYYKPTSLDEDSQIIKMTIKPYWCSTTVTDTTKCVTAGERVKIFNKRRDNFMLKVKAGLILDSIHIDSLDSIILRNLLIVKANSY